jgi:hypothetical protein
MYFTDAYPYFNYNLANFSQSTGGRHLRPGLRLVD